MNLLLFIVIIFSFFLRDFKPVFWLAFLSGLLLDLISGNLIGLSSALFLLICFLIYLYRRKFSSANFLFQLVFVLLADWLFSLLNNGSLSWKRIFILSLFSLIIFPLVNRIQEKSSGLELEI